MATIHNERISDDMKNVSQMIFYLKQTSLYVDLDSFYDLLSLKLVHLSTHTFDRSVSHRRVLRDTSVS